MLPSTPVRPPVPAQCFDTPIAQNENSQRLTNPDLAADRYIRLSDDIQKSLVAPMPVVDFIEAFATPSVSDIPSLERNPFHAIPATPVRENEMNAPLADCFNVLCPNLKFADTDRVENKWELKFDVGGYLAENIPECTREDNKIFAHFGFCQLWVELKLRDFASDESDVFCFEHIGDELSKARAKSSLGQMVAYAIESFARQYRTHMFSVFMTNKIARLMRWDRSGVIISSAVDYRKDPKPLATFLWRFSQMDHKSRGCDMSIGLATLAEEALFASSIKEHMRIQLGIPTSDNVDPSIHYMPFHVVKVPVLESPTATSTIPYLVSRPVVYPKAMASRATRGYWAVSLDGKVSFLKEAWRTDIDGMEIEGTILTELQEKDPCVPTITAFGDVSSSCATVTQSFDETHWNRNKIYTKLVPRRHYRQTVAEAGYLIETAAGAAEVFKAAFCAFDGIINIFNKTTRLHRDVSAGNIVLYADDDNLHKQRRGLLIDWELSTVTTREGKARDHKRTGTWSFASLRSILAANESTEYHHQLSDDLESIIYVIFHCAVSMLEWRNYSKDKHSAILEKFFGDRDGTGKEANMLEGRTFRSTAFEQSGINDWLVAAVPVMLACFRRQLKPKEVVKEYERFKKDSHKYLANLGETNRHENAHPLPGPSARAFYATTPTGTGSGFGRANEPAPVKPPATLGKRKRGPKKDMVVQDMNPGTSKATRRTGSAQETPAVDSPDYRKKRQRHVPEPEPEPVPLGPRSAKVKARANLGKLRW